MVESNCKNCGSLIVRYGKKAGVFCSTDCKAFYETSDWSLQDAWTMYEAGRSLAEIANHFSVSKDTIKKRFVSFGYKIRSRTEWLNTDRNPTKGKPRSKDVKKKLSKAATKQFSDPKQREHLSQLAVKRILAGKGPQLRSSKLEDAVALKLDELGIAYERQKAFRGDNGKFVAVVDFCIDGLLLEVNGTYWHCDPRKYPNGPEYESQKRAFDKHSNKIKYLEGKGYDVVEIWEIDINENIDQTLLKAIKAA